MAKLTLVLLAAALALASIAPAQTPTPTAPANQLADHVSCPVTPAAVGVELPGDTATHKSIGVTLTGTGTVDVMCRIGEGATQSDVIIGTQLSASGRVDTTAICDRIYLRCGGVSAEVSGWVR